MPGGSVRAATVAGSGIASEKTETTVAAAMARKAITKATPTTTIARCLRRASSIMARAGSDELDDGHFGAVSAPGPDPYDSGIPAGTLQVAGRHLVEEAGDDFGVADVLEDHPAGVKGAGARPGDHLLGIGAEQLRFGDCRGDLVVPEQLLSKVAQQRLLVSGVTSEPRATLRPRHQTFVSLSRPTASDRPSSSSLAVTSSRLFCPKLVILSRSSSVFCTSSPTVVIWARRRQLRGRSERSRASMGRSRSGEADSLTTTSPSTSPMPSPKSANSPTSSPRVLPADESASLADTEPSVCTSSTSLSKLVIWPTWVEPTVYATLRTGEKMESIGMTPMPSPLLLRSALRYPTPRSHVISISSLPLDDIETM